MKFDRRLLLGASLSTLVLRAGRLRAAEAPAGPDPIRVPVRLSGRRVLVDCTLNGKGPWPFVLDTGGTIGLIDEERAGDIGLVVVGKSRLMLTIGHKGYPIYGARRIGFGGVIEQKDAAFAGVRDFKFGQGAIGSLAAGVLTTLRSELDLVDGEWRIYPQGAPERAGWTRYDKAIVRQGRAQGSPFLIANVAYVPPGAQGPEGALRLALDTGAPHALGLRRDWAEKAGLWDAPAWTPTAPGGRTRLIRMPVVQLAGIDLKGVIAAVREDVAANLPCDGLLGLPILEHFDLATDPDAKAIFLRLNPRSRAPMAFDYNRAGLWIDRHGEEVRVGVVGAGSPAAAAGLAPGDVLVDADFDTLVKQVHAPAGTRLPLVVARGEVRRKVELVLADFL